MAKEKQTQEKPAKGKPVTFRDTCYVRRTITFASEAGMRKIKVKNSLVTVQDPEMINALEKMYSMKRETN